MEPTLDGTPHHEAGPDLLVREPRAPEGGLGALLGVLFIRTAGVGGSPNRAVRSTSVRIGRAVTGGVGLPHPSVSAEHAELRLRGGVWTITDLGSMNGSWVDGEQALGPTPVASGSEIRLGDVVLAFDARDRWDDSPVERAVAAPLIAVDALAEGDVSTETQAAPAAVPVRSREPGRIVFGDLDYQAAPSTRRGVVPGLIAAGIIVVAIVVYLLLQAR